MTPRLLLLKIITLLHLETQIEGENARSSDLATSLLATIKIPEADVGLIDSDRDIIGSLYNICRKLSVASESDIIDKSDLLQEVRLNCGTEVELYESFKEGVILESSQEGLKKRVAVTRRALKDFLHYDATKKKILEMAYDLRFKEAQIEDMDAHLRAFSTNLENDLGKATVGDEAIVGEMNMDDLQSVVKVVANVQDEDSGKGRLKCHLQDVNDMLNGGQRRGEFICSSALPGNNKTGFSLDYFAGVAMNNDPFLFNEKKKPMLLRISFEDDIELNFRHLYTHLWEREFKQVAVTKDKDPEEMAQYVMDKLTSRGWHVRLIKVDPAMWSIFDLFAYVRSLEAEGYEIALCMLDYMRKMATTGCVQGIAGADIKDMARRCRNFFNVRKTAFYTPHQISTQAKEKQRDIPRDFVKILPQGGYYEGCKGLDAEIDFELFQHIEKQNGFSYLTLHRGKHRGAPPMAEDKKYLVYQFNDIGGIDSDMGKERSGLRKVGGVPGGGHAYADMDY